MKSSDSCSDSLFRFTRGCLLKNPDVEGVGTAGPTLLFTDNPLNNITAFDAFSLVLFQGMSLMLQLYSFICSDDGCDSGNAGGLFGTLE